MAQGALVLLSDGDPCSCPRVGALEQGRLLHLLPAKAPPQVATVEEVAGSEGFKALKEAKLKAGAGDRKIWSSLFVRADTVAEAIAAKFGAAGQPRFSRVARAACAFSPMFPT